jgi:hypothetical protein
LPESHSPAEVMLDEPLICPATSTHEERMFNMM